MTFADELRNSKGTQLTKEEIASRQYCFNFGVKCILNYLKDYARSMNRAGKHSVSGYLAYYGYDNDNWRLVPIKDKILPYSDLGAGGFGIEYGCHYDGCIDLLRSEIEKGLKQLGFKVSVKRVEVPFYKETENCFFRKKLEKYGTDITLKIEFSW